MLTQLNKDAKTLAMGAGSLQHAAAQRRPIVAALQRGERPLDAKKKRE